MDSNLVLIPVSVTDSRNHAITGLEPDAFRIFDDKAEQTLVHFAHEDVPLSVGIVLVQRRHAGQTQAREAVEQFSAPIE